MALNSLKDIYIDQLQDLHSACEQSLSATEKLRDAASDGALRDALAAGVEGIRDGMGAIAGIVKRHGADPSAEHCKGMAGLVKEAQAHAIEEDFGDASVRDAMIITQYQRMTHYAIAGYGCLVAFAQRLALIDEAATLQECLDACRSGDRHMTEIATAGGVNAEAAR
jgi:ferritin-like metal-binding protein YciE